MMSDEGRTTDAERRMTDYIGRTCSPVDQEHCVTCSDEATPARVLRVDQETFLALVVVEDGNAEKEAETEVDISLVDDVVPGDLLLVHGGVAIAKAEVLSS